MCGIAGISQITDITRRMIPHLLWDIEARGQDSWGATNGTHTVKELGSITRTFASREAEIYGWDRAIFHTRSASVGAVNLANQHPFHFIYNDPDKPDHPWVRTIQGIHNGCVLNHETLAKKYDRSEGFQVDSAHIFAHFAEGRDVKEVCGWGNIAWYEYDPDHPEGWLRMERFNSDNLHIARLKSGEIVFCSTYSAIARGAWMAGTTIETSFEVKENTIYNVEFTPEALDRPVIWHNKTQREFGTRYLYEPITRSNMIGTYEDDWKDWKGNREYPRRDTSITMPTMAQLQAAERSKGICAAPGCKNEVRGKSRKLALVCESCVREAYRDFHLLGSTV